MPGAQDLWPPPMEAYTLARRCPRCHADPGEPCNYRGSRSTMYSHAPRITAGIRHYNRDVGRAPWPEDRESGRRYDSLGDRWTPPRSSLMALDSDHPGDSPGLDAQLDRHMAALRERERDDYPPEEVVHQLVNLRCAMHTWKRHIKATRGVDSWAFRKAYDVEQRLANACYDAAHWAAAMSEADRPGF